MSYSKKIEISQMRDVLLKELLPDEHEIVWALYNKSDVKSSYAQSTFENLTAKNLIYQIINNSDKAWGIYLISKPDLLIGVCAVHHFNPTEQSIEIGGTLDPNFWGQNIMFQVYFQLEQYIRSNYCVKRILANTLKRNMRAISLARKIGFKPYSENKNEIILVKEL